jgi:hypothetical protein
VLGCSGLLLEGVTDGDTITLLDAGQLGGPVRRAVAAVGRCAQGGDAGQPGAAQAARQRLGGVTARSAAQVQRAAAVMSLLHSAKLNGHDPYAYLKDVLTRLPTQPAGRIEDLLPHRWRPAVAI